MRLPGSVAEVMASPPGPKIGAFFDLDGTLVAGFTAVILTQERFRSRDMGIGELITMIAAGLNHQLGRLEFEELITKASQALRGRALSDLHEIGERLFIQKIEKRIYPEMRELVHAHMERGHTVVLSSSALTLQVEPVAQFLGIENTLTNKFEVDEDDVLTGEVVRPILWGPGKANAVQKFAADNDIDLKHSYFYADGDEDVALMYLVGNPRPTNPEGKMAAVARRRGWPILEFSSRGGGGLLGQVRTLLGVGVAVSRRDGRDRLGSADPQQAPRRELLHHRVPESAAGRQRCESQRARCGEPHQEATGGVHLQPPQQLRPRHLGGPDQGQLDRGGQEGTPERPGDRHVGQAGRHRVHRPRRPEVGDRVAAARRGSRREGPVDPDRAGRHPVGHPHRRPVQEGPVPAGDGRRCPDRADRHPQRRGDRAAGLLHDEPGNRGCRCLPADFGGGLDFGRPVRADRRRCGSSTSTP